MNNLIDLTKDDKGNIAVSGRELHKGLKFETPYKQWMDRMIDYGFEEEADYILVTQKSLTNNPRNPYTKKIDHIMTLDMAKEISMIQRNDIGKKFRKYFINVEKKYVESLKLESKENKITTVSNNLTKETTLETWRKDIKDNIDKIAIDNSDSFVDRKDITKHMWIKLYELFDFNNKNGKGLREELSKMKKQWKRSNKGQRCTLNSLDYIAQDPEHIELFVKCYNTLSKNYESPYKLSMDNKVSTVITKEDVLQLKQLSEMVSLQSIVEGSGNETPRNYRQELFELINDNEPLLQYAIEEQMLLPDYTN